MNEYQGDVISGNAFTYGAEIFMDELVVGYQKSSMFDVFITDPGAPLLEHRYHGSMIRTYGLLGIKFPQIGKMLFKLYFVGSSVSYKLAVFDTGPSLSGNRDNLMPDQLFGNSSVDAFIK